MDLNTENITAWLDSPEKDFEQGLALLAAFSPRNNQIRVLKARGSSVKSLKTLSYELGKIERSNSQGKSERTIFLKPSGLSTRKSVQENPEKQSDDPVLHDLVQKKNKIFKDYVAIFHQLEYMKKPQRMLAALHSLKMWDEIRDLWKQIDYYKLYRQIMPVRNNDKKAGDQVSMVRRMMTIRTYITRYEKKLASVTTQKARDKWQRKLDEFNLEKQDLERKLNR